MVAVSAIGHAQGHTPLSGKVVPLNGCLTRQRERQEDVIAEIQDLLDKAESGEIISIRAAFMYYDGTTSYVGAGKAGPSLIGEMELLKAGMVDALLGED